MRLPYLLFGMFVLTGACKPLKETGNTGLIKDVGVIAAYEDSVQAYNVVMLKKGTFYYSITHKTINSFQTITYNGKARYTNDTVYFEFDKSNKKPAITSYMVIEASRKYLIQYFTDKSSRIFLRIAHPQPAF